MKTNKLLVVLAIFFSPFLTTAQTLKEATEAYNAGATMFQDKMPEKALEQLYLAIELSEGLDVDGEETKRLAEDLLPKAHLQYAMNLYREKDMVKALEQLEKAKETAIKYYDKNTQGRVDRIIPQLYNQMGNNEYREENYEKAINYYNKAIEVKANYPDPYLGIALAHEKQESYEDMLSYLKKTIEVSNAANDREKEESAVKKAKGYLLRKGDEAQKAKNFNESIGFFEKSLEFDNTDGAVYYVISDNFAELKNWDKVIEYANLALENRTDAVDEAGVYYQIGTAYQNQGDTVQACAAFNNALSGTYRAAAEYQIKEVLKCN
ncbi:MAG: tetratricopeptide repeat protein [Tenuifilaceae bacterium]|nr:tetratricopeptide repeat protein [Tenuifilaceae bacterium]